jgi:methionine-gamma-lyase
MTFISPKHGMGTLMNHVAEGDNPLHAHVTPIYQTSTFCFPDAETGGRIFAGEEAGYAYTRTSSPNAVQLAQKFAVLEGIDLIRAHPNTPMEQVVAGRAYGSGMAAITSAILGRVRLGDTIIAQRCLYGNTFAFLYDLAPGFGINVEWVDDLSPRGWEEAFAHNPGAVMAYVETPSNPTLDIVDLRAVAEIAHAHGAWVMVDNTFATPYHTRPLSLGCDVVVHSTTKYLAGHGVVIGGAIVSSHLEYMDPRGRGVGRLVRLGGSPSPFDCWLVNNGLKTFHLRMKAHNENASRVVEWLTHQPKVERIYYPGLPDHPGHEEAARQMENGFGGMVSFELKGGIDAGVAFMNHLEVISRAVSLGTVDSLIEHPASMTHAKVPKEERLRAKISDGLVRLSVGLEEPEDLIADMDQAMAHVQL